MKKNIYINSRLLTEKTTGIQSYIKNIFFFIQKLDIENDYLFIQNKNESDIGSVKVVKTLRGTIGAFVFDVFLSQKGLKKGIFHGMSFVLPLFRKRNIKYVLSVHDLSFLIFKQNQGIFFYFYYKIAIFWSLRNADKVIAISENTKKDIIKFYGTDKDKIEVIYLDGDKELIEKGRVAKRIISEKYFLALSTHPKRKNVISILKAISESSKLQKLTFVLAGKIDNDHLIYLNKMIKNLKLTNVRLLGYVSKDDLASLYKYAEFFIYPSFYEGFGIPVVDSLKLNCPVITSNTSCLPEVVPENYKFLVDPYSINDIKNKMEKIISLSETERKSIIEDNLNFSKKFNWEESAKQTINIYNKLC